MSTGISSRGPPNEVQRGPLQPYDRRGALPKSGAPFSYDASALEETMMMRNEDDGGAGGRRAALRRPRAAGQSTHHRWVWVVGGGVAGGVDDGVCAAG